MLINLTGLSVTTNSFFFFFFCLVSRDLCKYFFQIILSDCKGLELLRGSLNLKIISLAKSN